MNASRVAAHRVRRVLIALVIISLFSDPGWLHVILQVLLAVMAVNFLTAHLEDRRERAYDLMDLAAADMRYREALRRFHEDLARASRPYSSLRSGFPYGRGEHGEKLVARPGGLRISGEVTLVPCRAGGLAVNSTHIHADAPTELIEGVRMPPASFTIIEDYRCERPGCPHAEEWAWTRERRS